LHIAHEIPVRLVERHDDDFILGHLRREVVLRVLHDVAEEHHVDPRAVKRAPHMPHRLAHGMVLRRIKAHIAAHKPQPQPPLVRLQRRVEFELVLEGGPPTVRRRFERA
jgi:hypothetical protein